MAYLNEPNSNYETYVTEIPQELVVKIEDVSEVPN